MNQKIKKICIITDAYKPQINGVVRTYENLTKKLEEKGYSVTVINPSMFKTVPLPLYPEIKLSWNLWNFKKVLGNVENYDAFHIATEGPLGIFSKFYFDWKKISYTTSYCTKFPEYLKHKINLPLRIGYSLVKYFHKKSSKIMVSTNSMIAELVDHGFSEHMIHKWSRGVDTDLFIEQKHIKKEYDLVYMGRVSNEKNLEEFFANNVSTSILVIGGGPQLEEYKDKYRYVDFVGPKSGKELVEYLNKARVFVFPSKTDTFGLVMLEANACGLPVAAFITTGPIDVITNYKNGYISNSLNESISVCMLHDMSSTSREEALKYSWDKVADRFVELLESAHRNS